MDSNMNGQDGSIGPAGRFQRMEDSLQRIENKLDHKAETKELAAVAARVLILEAARTAADAIQNSRIRRSNSSVAFWGLVAVGVGVLANLIWLLTQILHTLHSVSPT